MKKLLILLALVTVLPVTVFADVYGIDNATKSLNKGKFHTSSCDFVKLMKPEYLIKFQTADQAKKAGYVRCKLCKPN